MKKTLIALATTATIALGTAGVASATSTASFDVTAGNAAAAVEKVGYRRGYRFRYGYRYYGYGYGYRHTCKRLYYKGWVLGWAWARYKYFKYCSRRYGY